jgi:hypothetical protein
LVDGRLSSGVANLAAAIIADPAWLPHRVLDEGSNLELVHASRAKLRTLSFVGKGNVKESAVRAEVPVAAILDRSRATASESCHYIFHSAFCCSTLMSRALDIEGVAFVLKEPQALADLAKMMPKSGWPEQQKLALEAVLDLMQRPRLPGEKTIIKAATIADPLIDHLMDMRPQSRALLMYASLPDYLLAIARGRRWEWARVVAASTRDHIEFETPETRDLLYLTDFQTAALLWLQHQAKFARLAREHPTRVATLRADVFLERRAQVLSAVAKLFGLAIDDDQTNAIVAGPVFRNYAKKQQEGFNESVRRYEDVLLKLAYGPDMERAIEWAAGVAAEASVPLELQAPLIH